MNLRDLHYIVAVADLQNFGQAADRCFISQPTLSMQIKKLEESLGIQIFERHPKKVITTEVGHQVIAAARRIIDEAKLIKDIALSAQNPLAGTLRLGAFPTLAPYLFPTLIPNIKAQLPDLRLILIEEKTHLLLEQLSAGELDIALLALPVENEHLQAIELFDDIFVLATGKNHPLSQRSCIHPQDLDGHSLLLLEEGHCLRGHALQVCQINNAHEDQDVRATSLETLRQMVRAGTGITFMPKIAIQSTDEHIRYIPFSTPQPCRKIGLVCRQTYQRQPLIKALTNLIKQTAVEIELSE